MSQSPPLADPAAPSPARRAFITGAGKGIGRAVALRLAQDGWTVAASARTAPDLDALAADAASLSGKVLAYPLDVADPDAVTETVARIEAEIGALDLAILNAGTYVQDSARDFDVGVMRKMVDTNLMGTVHGLAAVMPGFIARGRGHIAVVASVAGYCGLPVATGYGATKAALINLCESLKPELDRYSVTLTLINPGFVDTPLTQKNDFPMPFLVSAEEAAERIVSGLESRRFEVVFPWRMKLTMKLLRSLPYWLLFLFTRRLVR